jgi:hypothetical protein
MADEPNIAPEELASFRRCTFTRRVFASYPSLRAREPMDPDALPPPSRDEGEWYRSMPYTGEPFDPEEYELVEGGWDHEHCDVCWAKIVDGMSYWPNANPPPYVDLCEACYPRVMPLLDLAPDAEPGAEPDQPEPR